MRRVVAVGLGLAVLLTAVGCGDSSQPGNGAVYKRIADTRDCRALQHEFDTAMSNAEHREPGSQSRDVSESYAHAADDRLRKLGCY